MMRLSFGRDCNGNRGIDNFLRRLSGPLSARGVRIVGPNDKSDIHLSISRYSPKPGSKTIVRVDGVYYDIGRLKSNQSISMAIRQSHGVIFQSKWSEIFATRMLGVKPRLSTVIHNGSVRVPGEVDKRGYSKVFVACAHWRPNKRPEAILRAFADLGRDDVGLFFVGEYKSKPQKNVVFFGGVNPDLLNSIYLSSDYMVHISHLDACPNSVVEALVYGKPVLCNNIGGTPELVGSSGIILDLDKPFMFTPVRNMDEVGSQSIDSSVVTEGMQRMMSQEWDFDRPDLYIDAVAEMYLDFFERVLL